MKKFYLLLLNLLLFCASSAQPYESMFGQQSTFWVIEWSNFAGKTIDTIFVVNDTSVNNISYKKIRLHSTGMNAQKDGLLRENTQIGKVWYRSVDYNLYPDDTLEVEIANFSLNIGDTFDIGGDFPIADSVKIVDSVYYQGARKIIQFKGMYKYGEKYNLVEGVSGLQGVFYKQRYIPIQEDYLLCAYKDGVNTFLNKYYKICNPNHNTSVVPDFENLKLIIYPNPVNDIIQINNVTTGTKWQIIDMYGKLHFEGMITDSSLPIYAQNLPIGVYFIHFTKSNSSFSHIFAKQ